MTQEVRNLAPLENARLNARLDYSKDTFPLVSVVYSTQKTLLIKIPQSFALMSICWGATDFGKGKPDNLNLSERILTYTHREGYDMANQTAYLDSTLRWGLDWLIKVAFLTTISA